jgi:hypothetical protein
MLAIYRRMEAEAAGERPGEARGRAPRGDEGTLGMRRPEWRAARDDGLLFPDGAEFWRLFSRRANPR